MQNIFNDINLAQCRRLFLKNYEISIYGLSEKVPEFIELEARLIV